MSLLKNFLDNFRPDHTDNKQVDTVERVISIHHFSDAIGWRPLPYTVPESYEQFVANLDSDIESFIAQANPDRYNPRFYEKTVEGQVTLALKELEALKTEHKRSIHHIRIYQKASLANFKNHLQRLEDALKKNNEVE